MSPPCATPEPPLSPPTCAVSPPSVSPPCATPTPPVSPPGSFAVAIDCDVQHAGIQSTCDVPRTKGSLDVAIVATNNRSWPESLDAFNFDLHDSSIARLLPVAGIDDDLNGNPDFNNALAGTWECGPPPPAPNTGDDGGSAAVSRLVCYLIGGFDSPQMVNPGESIVLGVVHYAIPANAPAGTSILSLGFVALYDTTFTELGSCDPDLVNPITCPSATVNITSPASGTTPTPVATARQTTPVATRTRDRH